MQTGTQLWLDNKIKKYFILFYEGFYIHEQNSPFSTVPGGKLIFARCTVILTSLNYDVQPEQM